MPLDPIYALAVNIAEKPGGYALLLGSGISSDAGVLTGQEVFWDAVGHLYKSATNKPHSTVAELKEWFGASLYCDYNYSKLLGELCPTTEERRQFLEKYFVGKTPSPTHEAIARLVKAGYFRVVVTTNFDPLIEQALDAVGATYDVITSAEDLKITRPREQSPCRIVKPNGDFRRANLRNTENELADYPEPLKKELSEIVDRYGIIVVGYGGKDPALMAVIASRQSQYSLKWVSRGAVSKDLADLITGHDWRLIENKSAIDFFSELERKLSVLSVSQAGASPYLIAQEIEQCIRAGDRLMIQRRLDQYLRDAGEAWQVWFQKHRNENATQESIVELLAEVASVEAIGLASIYADDTDTVGMVVKNIEQISRWAIIKFEGSYNPVTLEVPCWVAHHLYMLFGACAIGLRRMGVLHTLLNTSVIIHTDPSSAFKGDGGLVWEFYEIKVPMRDEVGGSTWRPTVSHAQTMPYVRELFFLSEEDLRNALSQFDFTISMLRVKKGKEPLQIFGNQDRDRVTSLLGRIAVDPGFAFSYAALFGEDATVWTQRFDERMKTIAEDRQSGRVRYVPKTWEEVRKRVGLDP